MPKTNRKYKKRPNTIEQIHQVSKTSKDENHRRDAQAMVDFYVRNGFLPARLQTRAVEIIKLSGRYVTPEQQQHEKRRHYLYAISDGQSLKVGFSVNPGARLKDMQTANPRPLVIAWKTYCASESKEAAYQEKKLHRYLIKYSIRGEWFSMDSLKKIKEWTVKNNSVKDEEQEIEANELILNGVPLNF